MKVRSGPKGTQQQTVNQFEFPSVLYDTLFGLVLYFNMDSFLGLTSPLHFVLYLSTFALVIHWWLMFKSAADVFGAETKDSALNLILNIVYLICINYIVLTSGTFAYQKTAMFLLALVLLDLFWTFLWLHIKEWKTDNGEKKKFMNAELHNIMRADLILLFPIAILTIFGSLMSAFVFVVIFVASYSIYIFLTFKWKIIDLRII